MTRKPQQELKKGWTTGACATAAACAAFQALKTGCFENKIRIFLPRGQRPEFQITDSQLHSDFARCAVIKDAGDDPDVTHNAMIYAKVKPLAPGSGIRFRAGHGVGTVTKPGLPLAVGEPAINPKPREIMIENLMRLSEKDGGDMDLEITISVPGGALLAAKTWNPRLGIVGGISILGTTGIVIPYSCSAWIHSIHRGIDVARAAGLEHVAGATGKQSEACVRKLYNLPDAALLEMGDFAGGLLKYLRNHPLARLTIAGGFAKMLKLAQGNLDLHNSRSQVNFEKLSALAKTCGATPAQMDKIRSANTAKQALDLCPGLPLATLVARQAREVALATLSGETEIDILVIDRTGRIIGRNGDPLA